MKTSSDIFRLKGKHSVVAAERIVRKYYEKNKKLNPEGRREAQKTMMVKEAQ